MRGCPLLLAGVSALRLPCGLCQREIYEIMLDKESEIYGNGASVCVAAEGGVIGPHRVARGHHVPARTAGLRERHRLPGRISGLAQLARYRAEGGGGLRVHPLRRAVPRPQPHPHHAGVEH